MTVVGKNYQVQVIIQNKKYLNDPEGETIYKDLILKGGYSEVKAVRTAKMLRMVVYSASEKHATKLVRQLCEELRIFNPIVSDCVITVN